MGENWPRPVCWLCYPMPSHGTNGITNMAPSTHQAQASPSWIRWWHSWVLSRHGRGLFCWWVMMSSAFTTCCSWFCWMTWKLEIVSPKIANTSAGCPVSSKIGKNGKEDTIRASHILKECFHLVDDRWHPIFYEDGLQPQNFSHRNF